MTFDAFHNALRILRCIDCEEFMEAVNPGALAGDPDLNRAAWRDWEEFRDHPHDWFIRAPTAKSKALWAVVEARQPDRSAA